MTTGLVPEVPIPAKLIPVFDDSDLKPGQSVRYRGAYGGRGSGKTRTFAAMMAVQGVILSQAGETGLLLCGREFMNTLADSSFAEIKHAIASQQWLADRYDVGDQYIRTRDRRIEFAFIGLRHNLESVKSKAKIHILWVDEAEAVTETCWQVVIPTVREDGSEIWLTWNPKLEKSATNRRFRVDPPHDAKIVEMNWRDNPKFPDVLERERLEDLAKRPDSYGHVWEGEYLTFVEGAYFTRHLQKAKDDGRICGVPEDPLMTVRLFADIGGTGAQADSFSLGAAQFVGKEVRVVNHYSAQGQPVGAHLDWMRSQGYTPGRAQIWLPHDGVTNDRVFDVSYESAFQKAGYSVTVVPNQGRGAAMQRVEALRNLFPAIWFDEKKTEALRASLAWYHEKRDENRGIGLGPEHDWSSHDADMMGLMAVAYQEPKVNDYTYQPPEDWRLL